MNAEITVEYSKRLIHTATRRFWFRWIGWSGFTAFGFLLVAFLFLVGTGDRSWYTPIAGTILVLGFAVGTAGYFIYKRRAFSVFDQMKETKATMRFDDEGISVQSDIGSSRIRWKMIRKVWRFPEVWLLFYGNESYSTLPIGTLSDELKGFIVDKVASNGGKVL